MAKHSIVASLAAAASFAAALLVIPSHAEAQPTAMCVRRASGVPGDSGIPKPWFPVGGAPTSVTPDDPRWVGASGHSVAEAGAAIAPVELRSTWGTDGGQTYLYLSWQFHYTTGDTTTAHVLHLVFTQPGETINDASARVLRFRFRGSSQTAPATYCEDPWRFGTTCPDLSTSAIYTQFSRRVGVPGACGTLTGAASFEGMRASTTPAPNDASLPHGEIPWVANSLRYWNENGRWTVQIRIPVVSGARNLADGIDEGIKIAYQASVELTAGGLGYHRWPRDERLPVSDRTALVCDEESDPALLDVDVAAAAPALRAFHIMGGGPVATDPTTTDCGAGVALDWNDIGALDGAGNIVSVFNTTPDGVGVVRNTLVARIQNNSPTDIADGAMIARFRIANWGSQVPSSEVWTDVPVLPYDTDAGAWPEAIAKNTGFSIPPMTTDRQIQLPWAMTDLQFCQYTHDFASAPAWTAKCEYCDANNDGDAGVVDGVRVRGTTTCAAVRGYHQCMSVELRGGNIDFDRRGVARNMNFASLSSDEQIALIDLTGLPTAPGQTEWEVFLVAMPRNVPATVPAGTTGTSMIASNAQTMIAALQPPGGNDGGGGGSGSGSGGGHVDPDVQRRAILAFDVGKLRKELPPIDGLPPADQGGFDGYPREIRGTLVELHRIARIDAGARINAEELTIGLAQSFSGATVAQLVPTLDVYVFVRRKADAKALMPLNSFVLMGHHEGALIGMRAGIDGAERISPPPPSSASEPAGPRVYRVRVPVGQTKPVRPWMQALVQGEAPRLDDPAWDPNPKPVVTDNNEPPCVEPPQGCCHCKKGKKCPPKTSWQMFGEAIPFGIAAVIAGWRGRRRKKSDDDGDQRKK